MSLKLNDSLAVNGANAELFQGPLYLRRYFQLLSRITPPARRLTRWMSENVRGNYGYAEALM